MNNQTNSTEEKKPSSDPPAGQICGSASCYALLDLFCCAGGAGEGYRRAGFEVVGVDIEEQPNNPHEFIQSDALEYLREHGHKFDFIHASPPCQSFTTYRRKGKGVGDGYKNLIPQTRELLKQTRKPYVIENVEGSPLLNPVKLCGSSFGLDVRRHRLFESSFSIDALPCDHAAQYKKGKRFPGATNRDGRFTCEVGVWRIPLEVQSSAMGVDWMNVRELSQAIPPAYTQWIAEQFFLHNVSAHPIRPAQRAFTGSTKIRSRVNLPSLQRGRICGAASCSALLSFAL